MDSLLKRAFGLFFLQCFLSMAMEASPDVQWADSKSVKFYIEKTPLSIDQISKIPAEDFQDSLSLHPNLGFSLNTFWFRTALVNPSSSEQSIIFEIAYPRLEILDFYALGSDGSIHSSVLTGTDQPFTSRPIHHTHFAFPLKIAPHESLTLYMRTYTQNPLRFPVNIWQPEDFRAHQQEQLLIQGIYYGGIVIMVIYNMLVFFGTRSLAYLFYCVFVSCTASYLASDGGLFVQYIFTDHVSLNDKVTLLAILGANLFGIYFATYFLELKVHDPRVNHWLRWVKWGLALNAITPFLFPYHFGAIFFTVLSTGTSGVLIAIVLRALWRRQREAYFYAAAWLCLLIGTFAYGLLALGVLQSNFFTERGLQLGSFAEVTILSFALADRLNQMRKHLKQANAELAYHVAHVEEQVLIKTRDIRTIMEHIPLGVFSIVPGLVIHKDFSKSMKHLFCLDDIEGQPAISVLFDQSELSLDQKAQVQAALVTSIGEDAINFELNRHCLPERVVIQPRHVQHNLNLLWNPVCNEQGIVEKVLVTAHDSTRLQQLEDEAQFQKRELVIVRQILDVSPQRFHSFLRQTEQILGQAQGLLQGAEKVSDPIRTAQLILMNLHTLKGTARSLYFYGIADCVHSLEDKHKVGAIHWKELAYDFHQLESLIAQYRQIGVEKLGRRMNATDHSEIQTTLLIEVLQTLVQQTDGLPSPRARTQIQHLESYLYRDLKDVLIECFKSSSRLADELGKPKPKIAIESEDYGITVAAYDLLLGVMTHLLRNSLDHGLEHAHERTAKGKPAQGLIEVLVQEKQSLLDIWVRDDGAGLALKDLQLQGQKLGLLSNRMGDHDLADLIFAPKLSTRGIASDISGRGMGMPAVRDMLRREGGDAAIVLQESSIEDKAFCNFSIRLSLPGKFWTRLHPKSWEEAS